MAGSDDALSEQTAERAPVPRRRRWLRGLLAVLLLAALGLAGAWLSRHRIADNLIADQLENYDIPATYKIARVGPDRQVLTDIVVGDPARPDLTIERAEVAVRWRFGSPTLGRITLVRPRLHGALRGGTLSFGSLDKALFRQTGGPPGLPRIDLALVDGRARIDSDFGPIGLKADGKGRLDSGFAGFIAAIAPTLDGGGCAARRASLYARVTTARGRPTLKGPLRLGSLNCPAHEIALGSAASAIDLTVDRDLKGFDGSARLAGKDFAALGARARGLNGSLRATWRNRALVAKYSLAARGVAHPQASAALLTGEGTVRGRDALANLEVQADVEANGLRMGAAVDRALADAVRTARGTLAAPLLAQARAALAREGRASRLAATVTVRRTGGGLIAVIPRATLTGGSGAALLSLSSGEIAAAPGGFPRLAGNLATGGAGLPRIAGRMERAPGGQAVFTLRMAEYAAGGSTLEVPQLVIAQSPGGVLGFSGRVRASGPLPGGSARNLALPVAGNWSPRAGLALWRECVPVTFDRLAIASLTLERRSLTLCPPAGQAIVRRDSRGLRIAAGAPSLDLAGTLARTPIRLKTGAIGFAWPGAMSAKAVDVALGPAETASRFRISGLSATFGRAIAGRITDADVHLFAVPLDLKGAESAWRYDSGVLTLADASFRLEDRAEADRFNPLIAEGAGLTLRDNVIRADAVLREPRTRREVTQVAIVHNLARGAGQADLAVRGLTFDKQLQPDQLTPLALGVVANVDGTIRGTGRIDWSPRGVTSTGRFSSDSLDLAAAFGPVKGASGTVEFSDLIGLTTAPDQRIRVGSVNPGIEVTDGEVTFALAGGRRLDLGGARWPFMGGTLTLRQTALNLGTGEERRYVFEIEGLDAARFVQHFELPNISATGIFDGTLPIVFDASGNGRIENGLLIARPPGGNVSYLGALSYKDMGTMANFAFDALKSLDYQQMTVAMEGRLTGDIVTRVRFDGVKQGAGAKRNFITRRFENLPIRFNINIRAPFYQLITSLKAMYDPASVRDPRAIGLIDAQGRPLRQSVVPPAPVIRPSDIIPPPPQGVQTSESEKQP